MDGRAGALRTFVAVLRRTNFIQGLARGGRPGSRMDTAFSKYFIWLRSCTKVGTSVQPFRYDARAVKRYRHSSKCIAPSSPWPTSPECTGLGKS